MTDRQGALGVLASLDAPERQAALDDFYDRFDDDALVIDKWFALQAAAQRTDTLDQVERWPATRTSRITNPNRLRALAGNFAANQWAFHACRRARLPLPRRHDHRRRQVQPAGRGAAGAAARPLAALRAEARRR